MTSEAAPIDIETMPDLARLAREVASTGKRRVLRENGAEIAVLAPARPRRGVAKPAAKTKEEIEQVLSATFGSWKGLIDPEEFKRQRRELQYDDREPRTW